MFDIQGKYVLEDGWDLDATVIINWLRWKVWKKAEKSVRGEEEICYSWTAHRTRWEKCESCNHPGKKQTNTILMLIWAPECWLKHSFSNITQQYVHTEYYPSVFCNMQEYFEGEAGEEALMQVCE